MPVRWLLGSDPGQSEPGEEGRYSFLCHCEWFGDLDSGLEESNGSSTNSADRENDSAVRYPRTLGVDATTKSHLARGDATDQNKRGFPVDPSDEDIENVGTGITIRRTRSFVRGNMSGGDAAEMGLDEFYVDGVPGGIYKMFPDCGEQFDISSEQRVRRLDNREFMRALLRKMHATVRVPPQGLNSADLSVDDEDTNQLVRQLIRTFVSLPPSANPGDAENGNN